MDNLKTGSSHLRNQFPDSHVTLVSVHTVKQRLRSHPLDWQATLEQGGGDSGVSGTGPIPFRPGLVPAHSHVSPWCPSRCWFSYSSRCGGHHAPAQSLRSSSHHPRSPAHFGQPGPGGCTEDRAGNLGVSIKTHVLEFIISQQTQGVRVTQPPRTDEKWNGQRPGLNPQNQ